MCVSRSPLWAPGVSNQQYETFRACRGRRESNRECRWHLNISAPGTANDKRLGMRLGYGTSVQGLQGLQSYSSYIWSPAVNSHYLRSNTQILITLISTGHAQACKQHEAWLTWTPFLSWDSPSLFHPQSSIPNFILGRSIPILQETS